MKHCFARLAIGVTCVAFLAGAFGVQAAAGTTVGNKQSQAEALQREIDANGEKISMLAERYDAAKIRLDEASATINEVEARTFAAQADTDRIREIVGSRASAMYMNIGVQSPLDSMDVSSVTEAGSRAKYAATTAERDILLLAQLTASRQDLRARKTELESARRSAQTQIDAIETGRREVETANAAQAHLLAQVKGEIATLVKHEQARQAAAEKARSDARAARLSLLTARTPTSAARPATLGGRVAKSPIGTRRVDPANLAVPNVPAASLGATAAVSYAKAQLGKPYRYAGVGPDSYDCSGLTMMAWAQARVSMPHGSIAQGNMFPRVPDNALAPGDLVIYYPDHHHVGMYVGNGMTISATHTGDFIRLQPVFRSGYQFAVRPG